MRALLLALLLTTPALAATVSLTTPDGVTLHADATGRGSHGVLLVHDAGRTSADWSLFAEKLESKGYQVLVIDLRGHGESASILDADPDWEKMPADVESGLAWLRKRGAKQVSIVGAGLGANLALQVGSSDPAVHSLVLLSPGLNIKGFKPSQSMGGWGDRPLLLAAGQGDGLAANTVKYLAKVATGPKRDLLMDGDDSGANLLEENPNLEDNVLAWLAGNYQSEAAVVGASTLSTGEVESMESSGTRYGDKE